MLDIRLFRDEPERVREGLRRRRSDPGVVDRVRELDAAWRADLAILEELRGERNRRSKEIGTTQDPAERDAKIASMRDVNERIKSLEASVSAFETERDDLVLTVPNIPGPDVPDGDSDADNVVVRSWGEPDAPEWVVPHWDLGPALGIIDFERGVRLAGSRFYVLLRQGARMQRALISWMLDRHVARGYTEVYPPFVVRREMMRNAGQLPKFADNLYRDAEEDLWLIPTAEVPLTNMHAGEILEADDLPRRYTAYTACFRREKMSAGRDVRGIKRGHQFDKVEMYQFCAPEASDEALEGMLADAETMLAALELPYRVSLLATGDLGFASIRTYDLEVWAPGVGEWLEVSSVSNVGDFQARRAGVRYRTAKGGRPQPVHTLNGSGLALPRTLIAILENYQNEDGSVTVPEALVAQMGAEVIAPAT